MPPLQHTITILPRRGRINAPLAGIGSLAIRIHAPLAEIGSLAGFKPGISGIKKPRRCAA